MKKRCLSLLLVTFILSVITESAWGQVTTKYKIYCISINKKRDSDHKIIEEYKHDVLHVNVYANKVVITSDLFNWTFRFSAGNHIQQTVTPMSKFGKKKAINDIFFMSRDVFIGYTRNKEVYKIAPLVQICLGDGFYYNFNVLYGEIYDKKNSKWVRGEASQVTNYENDKVWARLRKDLGKLCPDFEYELSERINLGGDDPWMQ